MAIERLADSRAAEEFTATVLIENIQPGQTLTFEQLIERSEQIAQDTGSNDLRTRIFATDFLSAWYSANGLYRNAEMILTRTINTLPADEPLAGATLRCRRAKLWDELGSREDAVAVLDDLIARADADDAIASRCLLDRSSVAASNADAPGALAVRAGGAATLRPDGRRIGVRPGGHPDGDRRRLRHHGGIRPGA